jgi:hypothetical protein
MPPPDYPPPSDPGPSAEPAWPRKVLILMKSTRLFAAFAAAIATAAIGFGILGCAGKPTLTEEAVQNIVRRSYQYVALYNVFGRFVLTHGGWNTVVADTVLKDHTLKVIARPNNDTMYITRMLDLRKDPVILEIPAFDSKYVSLMVAGLDHYVNVPLSTRKGDFQKPTKMLLYTARTDGYSGEPVEGIDHIFESTTDLVGAIFRVMPHASNPARLARIKRQMQSVRLLTLTEYRGEAPKPRDEIALPAVGKTDVDTFGDNLFEVMQFVFNHTTFDPNDEIDQGVLAAYEPLGIVPGRAYDPSLANSFDGTRFRTAAQAINDHYLSGMEGLASGDDRMQLQFQPKGHTDLETLVAVSVVGPIGLPVQEAAYLPVTTADGSPLNAAHDYVIHMSAEELPPATAFWSMTLYDLETGFFIPNDRKKYSVGENAGMKLNAKGGIDVYVAAEKPAGVPAQNWLPIERQDQNLDIILRVYAPDQEKLATWQPPQANAL